MLHWKPEHLDAFVSERSPKKLFNIAVHLAQDLAMQYLGLNLRIQIATQTPRLYLYSNYPDEWISCYQRDDFYKQDCAAHLSHQSTLPVLWTDELYHEAPHFREAACHHGLRHGWTQSLHDLQHNESQISVARPAGSIDINELYEKAGSVQWLCHTLHAVLSEHHLNALCPPQPKMSARELEVLKWSAAGKTAADVACILSLSQSTVNFHIRSVITKTNAANKAGAIAIAALRGWI
ncbi:autoinducer binding domain-containing protein [Pseudomonas juntendi]|uniref:autoinducer binding domain-containing protein n=1 Tax=Pseudomonas juntendi TaxID=2666183 RepID=UPI001F43FCAD|nr:autoinducer binding domain-containing protein [Pseudomonas juntendi]MCO7059249.1 autoinducer binding domain-containing protein [Pseudomonas juntendi]UJM11809.1 autoinducer binding domain-containing protein [Pseudomonas juntendi]UXA37937.1 autoinducer binding domain-containing protein [Pseudomonas juntendi]